MPDTSDDEISDLAAAVNPAIFGQSPSNVLIYGKAGTGKSLCAKYVSQRLVETAGEEDVTATFAYVDCAQDTTETQGPDHRRQRESAGRHGHQGPRQGAQYVDVLQAPLAHPRRAVRRRRTARRRIYNSVCKPLLI
jgi:hypothetical protein